MYVYIYMNVLRTYFMAWCTNWYSYIAPSLCVYGAHVRTKETLPVVKVV
jgi:hypothetical protein